MMDRAEGGVLAAEGFSAGAAAAGIKDAGRKDVALLWSDGPAVTAAVFTQNSIKAAPVRLSRKAAPSARAVVVNSGNANCMTGEEGERNAARMAQDAAELIGIGTEETLVASTGIIGKQLPMDKVGAGIKAAYENKGSDARAAADFAEAIITTDTHPKAVAYACEIGGRTVTIGGCAKGSGMIQPNMATMLGFLTTDADITPELLDKALKEAVGITFNCLTIDGCSSTNDMVSLIANGHAGNPKIDTENEDYQTFSETLQKVCLELTLMLARDGEGATTLITVEVTGAQDYDQAKALGYAVANSPLVKTAANAKHENWGRIAQAVGTLGLDIDEDSLDIKADREAEDSLKITVAVRLGEARAFVYTCDFTREYIDINTEYN